MTLSNFFCAFPRLSILGKLLRSFRVWKFFTRKSVCHKNLKDKADDHYGGILLFKALLKWKSYVHLCFRIKVRNLRMSLLKGRMHSSS